MIHCLKQELTYHAEKYILLYLQPYVLMMNVLQREHKQYFVLYVAVLDFCDTDKIKTGICYTGCISYSIESNLFAIAIILSVL
jgi:hypothetical protein